MDNLKWKNLNSAGNVEIRVCWERAGTYIPYRDALLEESMGMQEVGNFKSGIVNALKNTWEKYAGVKFVFDPENPLENKGPSDINKCQVWIYLEENPSNKVKAIGAVARNEVHLNPLMLRYFGGEEGDIGRGEAMRMMADWQKVRNKIPPADLDYLLLKNIQLEAVHEFGHILGLYHEHQRTSLAVSFNEEHVSPQHAYQVPVAYYDKYSVMNYNNFRYDYAILPDGKGFASIRDRDGNETPLMPKLSCGDVIAARKLYPPPASKAAIAPCCTETGYTTIMNDPNAVKSPFPEYADFYTRNATCFEAGGIKIGEASGQSCIARAKVAAGADVCPVETTPIVAGEMTQTFCNWDYFANGEIPRFKSLVSLSYHDNQPWYKLEITIQNLMHVADKKVSVYNFGFRSASGLGYEMPAGTKFTNCEFNLATSNKNYCKIEVPMGSGVYDRSKDCFCGRTSSPTEGQFVAYDPAENVFLVDNTFIELKFDYRVWNGEVRREFKVEPSTCYRHYVIQDFISDFQGTLALSLDVGGELRVGKAWIPGANKAPSKPSTPSVSVSDNGEARIAAHWSPVTDPDNDPVYYFLEVIEKKTGRVKNHVAQQQHSLSVTGLRNTDYQVRVVAFDTKSYVTGDYAEIRTLDRPEGCTQANTEKDMLSGVPTDMIRSEIPLAPYKRLPSGVNSTQFWDYPSSFCVEQETNGLSFADIPVPASTTQNDWIYIEAEHFLNVHVWFKGADGVEREAAPGLTFPNDYAFYSGNFIRLADIWGESAKYYVYSQWKSADRPTRITLGYKTQPSTRFRARFGQIKILKENPFGLNYHGVAVNGSLFPAASVSFPAYVGEQVELEMRYHPRNLTWNGSLVGKLEAIPGSTKKFKLTTPIALGQNAHTLGANITYDVFGKRISESHQVAISITGHSKPTLPRIIGENGLTAKYLVRGKSYRLDPEGIIKRIRKITLSINGVATGLFWRNGAYWFTAPQPRERNTLALSIDGVRCNDLFVNGPSLMATSWLLRN